MKALSSAVFAILLVVLPGVGSGAMIDRTEAQAAAQQAGLHVAALQGDVDAIRRLIKAGADLNEKDAYGSTPLAIAATFGKTEAAKALIDAGADLTVTSNDGSTPLHIAAFFGRTEIVTALLGKGANKYLRNDAGLTALETVAAPFERVKGTYDAVGKALAPLGLKLDYARLQRVRPQIAAMLRTRPEELNAVKYTPLPRGDWKVSTPAAQGLDPTLVAQTYLEATGLPTLYALLVVKNGHLVAEQYFNEGGIDQLSGRQSMTKSVTSAIVGVALDRGCLASVDQKMLDFFPEFAGQVTDPRKRGITIRQLLQMRSGYPWEEREPRYFETLFLKGNWHWLPHIVDFPLTSDPGTTYNYSNLNSHLLAVIAARACKTELQAYAQQHLFGPIGAQVGKWTRDPYDYNWGWGEIYITARDMAKFGLLFLNDGTFNGKQVLSAAWVRDSLQRYSEGINFTGAESSEAGRYLRDIGYGYQWWSARAGEHRFDFAWGHGGNLIVLLHDLDMIIVTTADPLYHLPSQDGWRYEGTIIDLVGRFIQALPERITTPSRGGERN
jgi:CubicO group peptidase (beta-lactamase class C family)